MMKDFIYMKLHESRKLWLVGRSGDAGMGRGMGSYLCYTWIKETEKHWSGRKVNGWSDPACISPHPSHLTTLHLSRLTAG